MNATVTTKIWLGPRKRMGQLLKPALLLRHLVWSHSLTEVVVLQNGFSTWMLACTDVWTTVAGEFWSIMTCWIWAQCKNIETSPSNSFLEERTFLLVRKQYQRAMGWMDLELFESHLCTLSHAFCWYVSLSKNRKQSKVLALGKLTYNKRYFRICEELNSPIGLFLVQTS